MKVKAKITIIYSFSFNNVIEDKTKMFHWNIAIIIRSSKTGAPTFNQGTTGTSGRLSVECFLYLLVTNKYCNYSDASVCKLTQERFYFLALLARAMYCLKKIRPPILKFSLYSHWHHKNNFYQVDHSNTLTFLCQTFQETFELWFCVLLSFILHFYQSCCKQLGYLNGNIFWWNLTFSHKIWGIRVIWLVKMLITWLWNEISWDLVLKKILKVIWV